MTVVGVIGEVQNIIVKYNKKTMKTKSFVQMWSFSCPTGCNSKNVMFFTISKIIV